MLPRERDLTKIKFIELSRLSNMVMQGIKIKVIDL